MHAALNLLAEIAAASPSPAPPPPVAPTHPIAVRVGQGGEWFGPCVVMFASLVLDWSALGGVALQDRIAAAGYYSATLAMISIFEWSDDVQGWFGGSWSWKLTGSTIAAVLHVGLVIAMIGARSKWFKGVSKKIRDVIHMEHADSTANRINGTLLTWAAMAGTSSVLARGPITGFINLVGHILTGAWSWLANGLVGLLGG
jgi:hypothetical protein